MHDCLHVGIDLMYDESFEGHRVLEANAFGDLLPNLKRDGLSMSGRSARRCAERAPRTGVYLDSTRPSGLAASASAFWACCQAESPG